MFLISVIVLSVGVVFCRFPPCTMYSSIIPVSGLAFVVLVVGVFVVCVPVGGDTLDGIVWEFVIG